MTLADRLSRLSLFRWRLEWVVLLVAATALVLDEQAREQRDGTLYRIVTEGVSTTATVNAGRTETTVVSPRWTRIRREDHVFIDLEWTDRDGVQRRARNFRLDPETAAGIGAEPASARWPERVQILTLDRTPARPSPTGSPLGHPSRQLPALPTQVRCRPHDDCLLVVLTPNVLTPAEIAASNVDYVLDRAPHAWRLALVMLVGLLALRFAGVIDNRSSIE